VGLAACVLLAACGARTGLHGGLEGAADDATAPGADANVPPDARPGDAVADAPAPDVASACGDPAPGPDPSCKYGMPMLECFTHAELAGIWGTMVHDAASPPFDACGCLPQGAVADGCCIPAADGPYEQGGACCYHFCTGPCC
jgi:hypothetical protein